MTLSAVPPVPSRLSRVRALLLPALMLGTQSGCTREFFREWANQDVSEAVFEKSRDPRWRFDLFSVDPPALARYADPYDPDVPPAPPDDYASQALSPVPQWPDNRLIVPIEGTGYLDMLERWRQENPGPDPVTAGEVGSAGLPPGMSVPPGLPIPRTEPTSSPTVPNEPPPLPGTPAPFAPPGNSGPPAGAVSPNSVPGESPASPTGPGEAAPPQAAAPKRDAGVRVAAFQQTGIPLPAPPPIDSPPATAAQPPQNPPTPPPVSMDPNPSNANLSAPINPRPDLSPDQNRAAEAAGAELAGILVPGAIDFNEAEAAGLPKSSRPYRLTVEQAFELALINSRTYQFRIEQVYLASLALTLQRFAFTPQLYAGLSPSTPVPQGAPGGAGFAPPILGNQFLYNTRETGNPLSSLNIGTMVGFGKAFSSGARLLAGFANQVVFNFIGQNSRQPSVRSFLPLTLVQPFLRGGGRAVTLENLTQAERSLLYEIRNFTKFRQEFVLAVLLGGQINVPGSAVALQGFSQPQGTNDPVTGYLNVVQDIQQVENDRKNLAAFERLYEVYQELIQGESSGLSQLQLDQVDSSRQGARQQLITDLLGLRNSLDSFKMQMGIPPDTPLILDRTLTRKFKETFDAIDVWQADAKRDVKALPDLVGELPRLEDVILDGRSVLGIYDNPTGTNEEDELEELLVAAERIALEHRLDLMNARAQLYDAWRQIRVTANGLKGVFNVTIGNTFVTPPATNNPFAFLDQAKQFSLAINTELPLVRMAERNQFRAALIAYQRQRRTLQSVEDNIKLQVRGDIRGMQTNYLTYEITRQNLILTIRQKDQGFENIVAPPAGQAGGAQQSNAAIQTTNLLNFQRQLLQLENQMLSTWLNYQSQRVALYRDLGTLPYDEWEAFRELFPDRDSYGGAGGGANARADARPAGAAAPRQPQGAGR